MSRFRSYTGADDPPETVGDDRWQGFNASLDPRLLPPGMLSNAENVRMRTGQPTTRRGVTRPVWSHRLNVSEVPVKWGSFLAATNFQDPTSVAWIVIVDASGVWRLRPNNSPYPINLPAWAGLGSSVSLVQAFNKLFLFRGPHLRPLVASDLDVGFVDVVDHWDSSLAYDSGSLLAWGPWSTLGSGALTASGNQATLVFPAAHGLVSGADVTVRGASQTTYNGRFQVTVVNDNTVTYTLPATPAATPATGTITVSDQSRFWLNPEDAVAGQEPGVAADWARNYTVLPNGENAAFVNNRLFVPTAYLPGADSNSPGDYGVKADFLAATDVQDYRRFAFENEFRINQGSADTLQCVVKGSPNSLVCFKTASIYVLQNVFGDLTNLRLEQLKDSYGIVNPRAFAAVGRDLVFVASNRGVVSLIQSDAGEVQGSDIPMSDPISRVIQRVAWQFGSRIRLAYWDNKLYVALPIDDAVALGENLIPPAASSPWYLDHDHQPDVLRVGNTYRWTPAGGQTVEQLEINGVPYTAEHEFTYHGELILIRWSGPAEGVPSALRQVLRGVANAVVVFDYQTRAWQSIDSGPGICPAEFVVAEVHGRERLLALMADGTVGLYEESDDGDRFLRDRQEPIATVVDTRAYDPGVARWKSRRVTLAIQTWAPQWGVSVVNDGVNEVVTLRDSVTTDRTRFRKPFNSGRFDPEAAGANFEQGFREDYSVLYPEGSGLDVAGTGLIADRLQSFQETLGIPNSLGASVLLRFSNADGVAALAGVKFECSETDRREGSKV